VEIEQRHQEQPWCQPGSVAHWAADMTLAVAADVTLSQANDALAGSEQWLALDGPVGVALGVLASVDMTGPLRLGFGGWRDQMLGVQFVDGRERLITAGGRAMKNVAGYDLTKFMVGQRGVFGQVVALILRTYRRPTDALAVKLDADVRLLRGLLAVQPRPAWAVLSDGALWAGYLGSAVVVDAVGTAVDGAGLKAGIKGMIRHEPGDDAALRAKLTQWQPGDGEIAFTVWAAPSGVTGLLRQARVTRWWADASSGMVRGCCRIAEADRLTAVSRDLGYGCHVEGRAFRVSEAEAKVLRGLKARFDPLGRLNPLEVECVS
jgi:FAD/FMN-containing dehydrogenase